MKRELNPGLFSDESFIQNENSVKVHTEMESHETSSQAVDNYEYFQFSPSTAAMFQMQPGMKIGQSAKTNESSFDPLAMDVGAEFRSLVKEFSLLRGEMQKLTQTVGAFDEKLEDQSAIYEMKLQKLNQYFSNYHENQSKALKALEAKIQILQSQMTERESFDQKTQDLIERHNLLVRNFENKLTHLTRILSEQELQILTSRSALEEFRRKP